MRHHVQVTDLAGNDRALVHGSRLQMGATNDLSVCSQIQAH